MIDPIYLAVRVLIYYMITGLPVWQSQSESGWDLFVFFFFFFFSVSVKVLPVCFLRTERVVEMRRFLWWTQ